jgi:hypothetical protein
MLLRCPPPLTPALLAPTVPDLHSTCGLVDDPESEQPDEDERATWPIFWFDELRISRHKLHIFIDRSVAKVFTNGRSCMTVCVYPSRTNSLSVDLFAWWEREVQERGYLRDAPDTDQRRTTLRARFPSGNLTMSLSSRIGIAHELDHRHNLSRVQVLPLV